MFYIQIHSERNHIDCWVLCAFCFVLRCSFAFISSYKRDFKTVCINLYLSILINFNYNCVNNSVNVLKERREEENQQQQQQSKLNKRRIQKKKNKTMKEWKSEKKIKKRSKVNESNGIKEKTAATTTTE